MEYSVVSNETANVNVILLRLRNKFYHNYQVNDEQNNNIKISYLAAWRFFIVSWKRWSFAVAIICNIANNKIVNSVWNHV